MSNYTLKCLIVSDLALSLTVTSGFRTYMKDVFQMSKKALLLLCHIEYLSSKIFHPDLFYINILHITSNPSNYLNLINYF